MLIQIIRSTELYSVLHASLHTRFLYIRISVAELELLSGDLVVRFEIFKNETLQHMHTVTLWKLYF